MSIFLISIFKGLDSHCTWRFCVYGIINQTAMVNQQRWYLQMKSIYMYPLFLKHQKHKPFCFYSLYNLHICIIHVTRLIRLMQQYRLKIICTNSKRDSRKGFGITWKTFMSWDQLKIQNIHCVILKFNVCGQQVCGLLVLNLLATSLISSLQLKLNMLLL